MENPENEMTTTAAVDEKSEAAPDEQIEKDLPTAGAYQRSRQAVIGLAVASLVVAGLAAFFGTQYLDQRERDDSRASAVSVAEKQALALLSLSADNVDQRLDDLVAGSTGDFRRELEGIRETFAGVVQKGEVSSDGEVVSSAVRDLSDSAATVLLALSARVTNSETKKPEERSYRILVDLTKEEDQWLVSGMQFVP